MSALTDAITDLVHEPTQTEGRGLDLTVAGIHEVTAPGRVDFGGGELAAAETRPHESEKRDPEDDYEWWHLTAGQYLLGYNESLVDGARATVQPREALLARGASHPTVTRETLDPIPLSVGGAGIRLKENARVSTVMDVEGV